MTRQQRITLITISVMVAMAWLDMTILSVALPPIQKSFNATRNQTQWIVTIYLLFSAVLAFGAGKISDLVGHHRTFSLGAGLFILSSLGCGLSFHIHTLIFMRALQAIGGTFAVISGMSYLSLIFPIENRGRAGGVVTTIASISPIIAPFLGGVIIQILNWHWIFLVNVVIGLFIAKPLFTIFHYNKKMPDTSVDQSSKQKHFDYLGLLLISLFTVTITLIFNRNNQSDWVTDKMALGLLIALLALAWFISHELRHKSPVVDLRLFRLPNYISGCFVMFASQFVNYYIIFFGVFIQNALGYSPFTTGLLLLPMGILLTLTAPVGGALVDRYGAHLPMTIGFSLMTIGYIITTCFISTLSYTALLPAFFGYGLGASLLGNPIRVSLLKNTPSDQFGMSTAILSGVRQIGGVVGFAIVGMIIAHKEKIVLVKKLMGISPTLTVKKIQVLQGLLSKTPSSLQLLSEFSPEKQALIKSHILSAYITAFHSALLFTCAILLLCSLISIKYIKP